MRFGIIGCGDIAEQSFAPSLVDSDEVELAAVCRRDGDKARAFAQRFGGCAAIYRQVGLLGVWSFRLEQIAVWSAFVAGRLTTGDMGEQAWFWWALTLFLSTFVTLGGLFVLRYGVTAKVGVQL